MYIIDQYIHGIAIPHTCWTYDSEQEWDEVVCGILAEPGGYNVFNLADRSRMLVSGNGKVLYHVRRLP